MRGVAAAGDVLNPDGYDVTATKLAVDREIEHGEVTNAAFDMGPYRPDVFRPQRRLCADQVPGHLPMGRGGSH
jgi:hypothetical protein